MKAPIRVVQMHKIIGSEPLVRFFAEEPVFVCSHDGKAVFQNPAADALTERLGSKFCLFDAISPVDSVRYEILMNSNKPRSFKAAANMVSEYDSLEIIPIDVGDYRMSIVTLCREGSVQQIPSKPSREDMSRLLIRIGASEELTEHFSPSEPLFDMRLMTGRIVSEISKKTNIALDWKELDDKRVMPSGIGAKMYTYMTCASLSAMWDASQGDVISVCLENTESDYCLRISASYKGVLSPVAETKLGFASFIAENCGCVMESSFESNSAELTVRISHVTEVPNFKSHDQFAEFDSDLSAALGAMDIICREADPA